MEQQKFKDRCKFHKDEKIQFMRINNLEQFKSKPLFICLACQNSDNSYNPKDYIYIKDIINKANQEILPKWPPINNQEIINKLIEITNGQDHNINDGNNLIDRILQFFKQLRAQISQELNNSQKKMIKIAEDMISKNNKEQLIKEYQQISKLDQLREQLINNNINLEEKETLCSKLIKSSSENNTNKQLESLLQKYTPEYTYNEQPADFKSESLLKMIDSINLFQQNIIDYNINDVQLVKGNLSDGQNRLQISTNHKSQQQVRVIKESPFCLNTASTIILQANKRYLFRFKLDYFQNHQCLYIGLMNTRYIHSQSGLYDNLNCCLKCSDNGIFKDDSHCNRIVKQKKGHGFELQSKTEELELRVSIDEKLLEITNYPLYSYSQSLNDKYISSLNDATDLTLFIGLEGQDNTVTLTCAKTVDCFDE